MTSSPLTLMLGTTALFVVIVGFGAGPATLLLARASVPRALWAPVTLLLSMAAAYGVWWAFLLHPSAGRSLSVGCWLASVALFAWLVTAARDAGTTRAALADARTWLPLALTLALALAYLCVLFARDASPNDRFTWPLPPDNAIPALVADRITLPPGQRPDGPLLLDWLVSDRPPLQTALVLAVSPFESAWMGQTYQAVGTIAQMGWLPALVALMAVLGCSRRQMTFVLAATAGSGFFLVNSLYVWPKLLAAWLFLTAVALLYWKAPEPRRAAATKWPLIGGATGLSLLAHGGPFFSLAALPVLLCSLRPWRHERIAGGATAAACVLALTLAPWVFYQRVIDPPGNRIPKMHLAGVHPIDDRSLIEAMRDEYGKLSARDYWSGRLQNLAVQVTDPRREPWPVADWLRAHQFFHHVPALGVLVLGLATLWLGRRWPRHAREPAAAARARHLATYAAATIVVWALLLFDPGSASIQHGSYAATVLLFFGGALGLARWPPALGAAALGLHGAVFAWLWIATRHATAAPAPWQPRFLVAAAVFALLFAGLLRHLPRSR